MYILYNIVSCVKKKIEVSLGNVREESNFVVVRKNDFMVVF